MPKKGEFKLTGEQRAEVVRRYGEGDGSADLAMEFRCCRKYIQEVSQAAGAVRPERRAAAEFAQISRAALAELYCVQQLGMKQIATRFSVSPGTVRRRLIADGVRLRVNSEQQRADHANGRGMVPAQSWAQAQAFKNTEAQRRKAAATLDQYCRDPAVIAKAAEGRRRRVEARCWWCGEVVLRVRHRLAKNNGVACCCKQHSGAMSQHLQRHPNDPRPIIVGRLEALGRKLGGRWDYDRVERRLAPEVGAKEPEILAVLERLSG